MKEDKLFASVFPLFQKFLDIFRLLDKESGSLKCHVLPNFKDFHFKPAMLFPFKYLLTDIWGIKCSNSFCKFHLCFWNQHLMKTKQRLKETIALFLRTALLCFCPLSSLTICTQNKILIEKLTIYKFQSHNNNSLSWNWPAKDRS